MRKIITVTAIVVVATIATAWAVSMPSGSANGAAMGGVGGPPPHSFLLW